MRLSWLSFIFNFPCIYHSNQRRSFPQSSDLRSSSSLIALPPFPQCMFASPHLSPSPCSASPHSPTIFTYYKLITTTSRDYPLPPDCTLRATSGLHFDSSLLLVLATPLAYHTGAEVVHAASPPVLYICLLTTLTSGTAVYFKISATRSKLTLWLWQKKNQGPLFPLIHTAWSTFHMNHAPTCHPHDQFTAHATNSQKYATPIDSVSVTDHFNLPNHFSDTYPPTHHNVQTCITPYACLQRSWSTIIWPCRAMQALPLLWGAQIPVWALISGLW